MFHKFSATPAKARSQTKGSGSARANRNPKKTSDTHFLETAIPPITKRQKIARACDHCRLHRIKCDEQKPCSQCVNIKAKCIVSYASSNPPRYSQAKDSNSGPARHNLPPSSFQPTPLAQQESSLPTKISLGDVGEECSNSASHIQGFFASGQPASSRASTSAFAGSLFPQLPHPALPLAEGPLGPSSLLKSQRSYYLRLFWDVCHPLLQIMSETEFAELDALSPPTMFDEYSTRNALVDSMIALAIQHSHATGLSGRILGLQQQTTWPGFEYFHRSRECMRTNTEVTLEVLRCLALMALYFMKGNAIRDAYNLLGITVRKAYIAKLHRLPPAHLPEAEKTARTQLWWILFSLDFQCSLQLEMPAASQKSLIKCYFPAEDALANYLSPDHREESVNPCKYSICLVKLAVIVTDIGVCVSTADLVEDDGASLETHALNLSSALQELEDWRVQLPSGLLLSRNTEMLDFERNLSLPPWLQRQMVLLELHYHNSYVLIQRPFIRLRDAYCNDNSATSDSPKPHVELHSYSALRHAITIVDIVFTVCSVSDVLYGWSEVLQPLWNATLTIMAYVYANSLSSVVPEAFDCITRAQAVFDSFSPTCTTALSAKGTIQSLADSLRNRMEQGSCMIANNDPLGWDLFASLFQEQSTSNDIYHGMSFSPFMPSLATIDTTDFNPITSHFGESIS